LSNSYTKLIILDKNALVQEFINVFGKNIRLGVMEYKRLTEIELSYF